MKRVLCCVFACLLLCACGGKKQAPAEFEPEAPTGFEPETPAGFEPEAPTGFEPEAAVQALLDSGAYSETLAALDTGVAVMLFGLAGDGEQYAGSQVYYSTGATSETAAVLQTQDKDQAAAAEEALRIWIEDQIDACRSYQPAEVEKLEHAVLEVRGNTVLLAVAADWTAAADAVPAD